MLHFFAMGTPEIAIIAGVVVLLFGVKKLPEFAKGLGESIKEFKKASKQSKTDDIENKEETKKED